jgi:hypothetical protein
MKKNSKKITMLRERLTDPFNPVFIKNQGWKVLQGYVHFKIRRNELIKRLGLYDGPDKKTLIVRRLEETVQRGIDKINNKDMLNENLNEPYYVGEHISSFNRLKSLVLLKKQEAKRGMSNRKFKMDEAACKLLGQKIEGQKAQSTYSQVIEDVFNRKANTFVSLLRPPTPKGTQEEKKVMEFQRVARQHSMARSERWRDSAAHSFDVQRKRSIGLKTSLGIKGEVSMSFQSDTITNDREKTNENSLPKGTNGSEKSQRLVKIIKKTEAKNLDRSKMKGLNQTFLTTQSNGIYKGPLKTRIRPFQSFYQDL